MPPKQNENFREMIDHVLSIFPEYPRQLAARRINNHLTSVISRRPWSGLVKKAILEVPAAHTTGTVALTNGSNVATGTATSWSYNDVVNTTLSQAVTETGPQEVSLTSMSGVLEGQWLLIDAGESNEEAVFVREITSTKIRADFANTHDNSETVYCSSLSGRQFRVTSTYPTYTVTGLSSATRALLDNNWADSSVSAQNYSISMMYTDLGVRDLKMILTMVNLTKRWQFQLLPIETLDFSDPQRSATQSPYVLAEYEVDDGGSQLFEIYPRPTSAHSYVFLYLKQWEQLSDDYDILPAGINSNVIVDMTLADAYLFPSHKTVAGGIYYDPAAARYYRQITDREVERMAVDDDNTRMMRLLWQYRQWPFGVGEGFWYDRDPDSFYGHV